MDTLFFISAILLGLGGSIHCMGMCGPLAMAIPFSASARHNNRSPILLYYTAKATGYGIMGGFVGLIGKGFQIMNWQQALSLIAGIFIIAWAIIPRIPLKKGKFLFARQFGHLLQKLQHDPKQHHYFLLGLLNSFLPCGLVYTALAVATTTSNVVPGFIFMFLFGIGTTPALVFIILVKSRLTLGVRKHLRHISFVLTLGMGILLVLRGMDLGIPYISPQSGANGAVKHCCSK